MKIRKHICWFLLAVILIAGFIVRLYRFDNPIADWHSWRQADTSAVSRNFIKYGFDILHPRFDDLSNVPSGKDNPLGYRFVEFPIYNLVQAELYMLFPLLTLEEWGRMVTIIVSLISTYFIYGLVKKYTDQTTALFSAFFFTFIPFNIYYSRVILPDPSMVMTILAGIYFFDKWIEKISKKNAQVKSYLFFLLSLIFTAVAFLLKPYALFFTLPMIYLAAEHFGLQIFKQWKLYLYLIVALVPLVWWRVWMSKYPEGIPASAWLFNGNNIRFHRAFFYWIGYDRVSRLISGFFGSIFLMVGLWTIYTKKKHRFFLAFLLSSIIYVCVIATGNVQHDYYQILIIPSLAIFYGLGAATLFKKKLVGQVAVFFITICMLVVGWWYVKDYFYVDNPSIVVAGSVVNRLTPANAKIIAPYNGDTSFLYQTNRQGWAEFERDLPVMISQLGADYLILVNPTPNDFSGFGKEYKIVSSSKQYLLLDLHKRI